MSIKGNRQMLNLDI